jgi:ribosomal 50S subunit-associated protein YjgA (DUF615 family)
MRTPPPSDATGEAPAGLVLERPSKTRLKRQMHELQRLGQRLAGLPPAQLQYIGRLMRNADAEAIRARLAVVTGKPEAAP